LNQQDHIPRIALFGLAFDLHILSSQPADQVRVTGIIGAEGVSVLVAAGDFLALNRHLGDLSALERCRELAVDALGLRLLRFGEHLEQQHEKQAQYEPKK
jgi:hypothetical protein